MYHNEVTKQNHQKFGLNVEKAAMEQKENGHTIDLNRKFTLEDMKNLTDEDKLAMIMRL